MCKSLYTEAVRRLGERSPLEISEAVENSWKEATKELRKENEARRSRGQRNLTEKQWRVIESKRKLKQEKRRLKSLEENGGLVTYFIQGKSLRHIKIGLANNIAERLKMLQCGSPDLLEVLKTVDGNREKEFHKKFSHLRMHGEWFQCSQELLDFISKV